MRRGLSGFRELERAGWEWAVPLGESAPSSSVALPSAPVAEFSGSESLEGPRGRPPQLYVGCGCRSEATRTRSVDAVQNGPFGAGP